MFVAAQSFGLLSALLIGFTFNLTSITIKVKQQQHSIRHIIKEAFPFALLMALMALYTRIDAVMLDLLITDGTAKYHAGIYAQSFRLLDAGNIFALVLSGMLLPIFSRMIKQNESPKNMVNLSAKLVLIATLTVLLISFYFGYFIMSKLYHFKSEFEHLYSSTVLASLMIAFVAMSLVYVYGTLLTAANKIKKLNKIAAICLGINIILNYILIIEFDGVNRPAEGAAIATFVTQSMFVILCIRESFKLFKLEIQWKFLGKLLFYFVLLSSIYFYLIYLEYPIQIIFLIYISCGILFLFLFRLVDLKNTIALFKRE